MNSLNTLVEKTRSMSSAPEDLRLLSDLLKKSVSLFTKCRGELEDVFGALEPTRHTLTWLFLLDEQITSAFMQENQELVFAKIVPFIRVCSPEQLQYAAERFCSLCRKLSEVASTSGQFSRAILPLYSACLKLQPSPNHLTPIHADFIGVCVRAKFYSNALPILEQDIFLFDYQRTFVTQRDYRAYCHHGGLVYCGLKNFKKAYENLLHAAVPPSDALTLSAFKKLLLVSMIAHHQPHNPSRASQSIPQRDVKLYCKVYTELGNLYESAGVEEVKAFILKHERELSQDGNLGLAKQVISSLHKRRILKLTQTYLTLSLSDIASSVGLEGAKEAEMRVLSMIEDGEIHASISQKDGMVLFLEDPDKYDSPDTVLELDKTIRRAMNLADKVKLMNDQISVDKLYLQKTKLDHLSKFGDTEELNYMGMMK